MTASAVAGHVGLPDDEYRRRIRAWTIYDWANSAFATTILAAVLPAYYSDVAGSTLGSEAIATAYWAVTLSIALVIVAIISPILGTISDIRRGKKKFLAFFIGVGTLGTGLLVMVGSGDWLLASMLMIVARVGFGGANVFYDALLPHVARDEDQDRVSTGGYAVGYLGGGLLLAVNIVMIQLFGVEAGARLSFLTVAVWWAVFSIPILRRVPEPPAARLAAQVGNVVAASFTRLRETFSHLQEYRQLLRFLIAFVIYNDGIGTVIGVAVIYGAELGFGVLELVAAILLVQFVGIPFALIFGRISSTDDPKRSFFLAFVVWNLVVIPLVGIGSKQVVDDEVTGTPGPAYESSGVYVGEGDYTVDGGEVVLVGAFTVADRAALPTGADGTYAFTQTPGDSYEFTYHGREVELTYSAGPDRSKWAVLVDDRPVLEDCASTDVALEEIESFELLVIDGYNEADRFGLTTRIDSCSDGEHLLSIINTDDTKESSSGTVMSLGQVEVLPPPRTSSLGTILGLIAVLQIVGLGFAAVTSRLFAGLARTMTTKRTIMLALLVYTVIAVWGFYLDAVIEFWFLAWLVAVVQGGSQALSRSLYAGMSPTSESGEFFGFFSVMSKFSAVFGPLIFAGAVALFGSSRPAILSIALFFVLGMVLLARVDVDEGRRVAREADAAAAEANLIDRG